MNGLRLPLNGHSRKSCLEISDSHLPSLSRNHLYSRRSNSTGHIHKVRGRCESTKPVLPTRWHLLQPSSRQPWLPAAAAGDAGAFDAHRKEDENEKKDGTNQPEVVSSGSDSDADTPPPSIRSMWESMQLPIPPWGTGKIVQVMVLWLLAYVIIGQVAVPVVLSLLGLDREALDMRGHAVLNLVVDLSQLGVTLAVLWGCLRQYKPRERGFFPLKWQGSWPLVVAAACLVFPAVDWLAQQSMVWFPDADNWATQMESSLSHKDWVTNAVHFSVVSICAPIWEEAIFRGFLLASLSRYMSPQWAVAVSSLVFAMCHFRVQIFIPLLVLGVVFSSVFLITRNLVPPMVLHSAWNIFVLANLLLRSG